MIPNFRMTAGRDRVSIGSMNRQATPRVAALFLGFSAAACATGAGGAPGLTAPDPETFAGYWHQGLAEVTRYELKQSRYGEIHDGDAVLIFVTEDFLPDRQVKYESGTPAVDPRSVLKLNSTRKFTTGIYPYSTMTSTFTPLDDDRRTLKVSSSVQEWCGHVFQQLNLREDGYHEVLHSYFQDEADRKAKLGRAMLEDEIWTRIRIDPASLPVGELQVIPGLQNARMTHRPAGVERAAAVLSGEQGGSVAVYRLEYRDFPRTLVIRFETAFPFTVLSWQEHHGSSGDERRITRATRTHSIMTDYWNKNTAGEGDYRRKLGLD